MTEADTTDIMDAATADVATSGCFVVNSLVAVVRLKQRARQIMRFQLLSLGFGLFAIVAVGCSNETNTTDSLAAKQEERPSALEAPKIDRSAAGASDEALAASPAEANPAVTGSPEAKENDNPTSADTEPISSLPRDSPPGKISPPEEDPTAESKAKNDSSQFAELISEPYMPEISLASAQQATCLVGEGDIFPKLVLGDLSGGEQSLDELLGKKMTVVVFWQAGDRFALEELDDLEPLVSSRFGKLGVEVVAVSVRGSAQRNQDLITELSIKFPMLLDLKGDAWTKLASESAGIAPRTFLLDDKGQVLWFDIEYSRTTRRDLVLAIRHHLP